MNAFSVSVPQFLYLMVIILFGYSCQQKKEERSIEPVPFTSVSLMDSFWAPRIKINHDITIPIAIHHCYRTGRVDNFLFAARIKQGAFCTEYPFDDSDVYKIIEGASYSLQTFPDSLLEARIDTLIDYIGKAQEPDGYLYTNRTIDSTRLHPWVGKNRWEKDPSGSHELYNIGHLYEAAVAHFQATGKRSLLNIAIKSADLVDRDFGPGKLALYPGHQVVEMGLAKLYRVTGEERYLKLAKFFLDCRGPGGEEYNQAHKKVTEQDQIVGHAVRATYMYSGMADVASLLGEPAYVQALDKIWKDLIGTKFYVTGGIGSGGDNEGFDEAYYLPNHTAYCETCASIGNVFWNHRMFLLHGDAKYFDVLERTLYNGLLSGVSLSGDRFFYPNPLESRGEHQRKEWFGCACCPSNICRFMPSVPGYMYAVQGENLFVNLYIQSTTTLKIGEDSVNLEQRTVYPLDGSVELKIKTPREGCSFALRLRYPGWARNEAVPSDLYSFEDTLRESVTVVVNGKNEKPEVEKGYLVLHRKWEPGDVIRLNFPMPVRILRAHKNVLADQGRFSVQRGPLVFCAEWPDQVDQKVLHLIADAKQPFTILFEPGLLSGVPVILGEARLLKELDNGRSRKDLVPMKLIPYYAWANRGPGEMMVWIPEF